MSRLPRLVYVSDVPIRAISAGPAVLYRLLATYPAERILVCESDHNQPAPGFTLPHVRHLRFHWYNDRLMRSRAARYYSDWVYRRAPRRAARIRDAVAEFRPDAVLTLAHGYGWRTAAELARQLQRPLHMIVHDHWCDTILLAAARWPEAEADFGRVYQACASRLPISPAIERSYAAKYGAAGTVLYPCRSPGVAVSPDLQPRPRAAEFVFAYAGSAASAGQRQALIQFAHALTSVGAILRVYHGLNVDQLRAEGLASDNLHCVPFRSPAELLRDLRESADALLLPMSFDSGDRSNVELCFPSKIVDYTTAGLPIFTWAPEYATATTWVKENPRAAFLVTSQDPAAVRGAIQAFARNDGLRADLAAGAIEAGNRLFSHDAVFSVLTTALTRSAAETVFAA